MNIRQRIIDESPEHINGPIYTAYQQVYDDAVGARPGDDGMMTADGGVSKLALWAKNNAFVMLVGLDANGREIHGYYQQLLMQCFIG